VRGQVCDIPALGPWPYVIAAAVIALLAVLATGRTGRIEGGRLVTAAVLVPVAATMLVPLLLNALPRT
jgi:hypothetical protein